MGLTEVRLETRYEFEVFYSSSGLGELLNICAMGWPAHLISSCVRGKSKHLMHLMHLIQLSFRQMNMQAMWFNEQGPVGRWEEVVTCLLTCASPRV